MPIWSIGLSYRPGDVPVHIVGEMRIRHRLEHRSNPDCDEPATGVTRLNGAGACLAEGHGGYRPPPSVGTTSVVAAMADEAVTEMLGRLAGPGSAAAWADFMAAYSAVMLRVVRRHYPDPQAARQCFDHVGAALADAGFRRLLSFRPDGPARFQTWLMAVVSNLCIDWRRHEEGRRRAPRVVLRLPDLDREVYHCLFELGMTRRDCFEALSARFPGLTFDSVVDANSRIFASLTSRQRWQLSHDHQAMASVGEQVDAGSDAERSGAVIQAAGAGLDEACVEEEDRRLLHEALSQLSADERLLLQLRYEQGLTLAEVARLSALHDAFRANRRIKAALARLSGLMCQAARKS